MDMSEDIFNRVKTMTLTSGGVRLGYARRVDIGKFPPRIQRATRA